MTVDCQYTDSFEPRSQSCEMWLLTSLCLCVSIRL